MFKQFLLTLTSHNAQYSTKLHITFYKYVFMIKCLRNQTSKHKLKTPVFCLQF